MSKAEEEGLQKHTLNLFPGDYEELRALYPDTGAGAVIRRLVRHYITQVKTTGVSPIDAKVEIEI